MPVPAVATSGRYLGQEERLRIADLRLGGAGVRAIARDLGRSASTISRELRRNSHPTTRSYRPYAAQKRCVIRAGRPKPSKLDDRQLAAVVEERLRKNWSPQQISDDLAVVFAGQAELQVSHESIYQSLYVHGRGYVGVRLHRHLRRGRSARKPRVKQLNAPGKIRDKVMLSERPEEANDRLVAGHWEGDLIVGSASGSAIATLVERTTRFVVLVHLPNGHSSAALHDELIGALDGLPVLLRRSLTWDQATELARHVDITKATGVPIFFCDPASPWQRGSNENTNGLLRQYFPKGTDLNAHSAQRLLEVATELNERPRKTLKRRTPADLLSELVSRKELAPVASTV
ncbi:IS30 family transposase [Cryobacterium zongtaii]|uniref:IS30 family transposase n=1 Tax=Cryobacterium zongtaii TaxID=1259217 RepID=A0A2S3ZBD1_9MICO|nr:IS30 family transposase [Cryobacterium zongtaii]